MTGEFVMDAGALYEKAAEVAERAITVDPDTGYALGDVVPDEDDLATVFHNTITAQIFVEGTLTGCVTAIGQTRGAASLLAAIDGRPPAPAGVIIEPAQFDTVISWLKVSVAKNLDADQRSKLVVPVVYGDNDMTRRSAHALALVVVTDAVCQEARHQGAQR